MSQYQLHQKKLESSILNLIEQHLSVSISLDIETNSINFDSQPTISGTHAFTAALIELIDKELLEKNQESHDNVWKDMESAPKDKTILVYDKNLGNPNPPKQSSPPPPPPPPPPDRLLREGKEPPKPREK